MLRPKNPNEMLSGIFLVLVALLALYLAWPLSSRTDVGLGPGFVPRMLAVALLALGAPMIVHGLRWAKEERTRPLHLRPVSLVLGSVAFFAASIESLGMVIAVTGLVLLGCAANREARLHEALMLTVGSVVVCVLLFVNALGLQIPLWPTLGAH